MKSRALDPRRGIWLVAVACAAAGLVAGWSVATGRFLIVLLLAAIPVLVALAWRAWVPYAALVVSVSSAVWVYAYPQVNVVSYGIFGSEMLLVVCLIVVGVKARSWDATRITGFAGASAALGVFLCTVVIGVAVAMAHGTPTSLVLAAARPMIFYVAFWVALAAVRTARLRRSVVTILGVVACAIVALQITQSLVGAGHTVFVLGSYTMQVSVDPTAGGVLRIRPPGLTLVYVTAAFAAAYLLWGPRVRRLLAAGVLSVCGLGILLSLNRNMMLGLVVGVVVAGIVSKSRGRLAVGILVSGLIVAGGLAVVTSESRMSSGNAIVQRTMSLADVRGIQEGTLEVRTYENRLARKVLGREWLGGIGWGTSYGATLPVASGGTYIIVDRPWIHNQYYSMWLRAGIVGLAALLVALGLSYWHAVRQLRHPQAGSEAWMAGGAVAALTALMASATVGLYFSEPASIVPLVGVMALAIALDAAPASGASVGSTSDTSVGG